MINFVEIKQEDVYGEHFAFFCTVMGDFVSFRNTQIFNSVDDFKKCYNDRLEDDDNRDIERFLRRIPSHLFKKKRRIDNTTINGQIEIFSAFANGIPVYTSEDSKLPTNGDSYSIQQIKNEDIQFWVSEV